MTQPFKARCSGKTPGIEDCRALWDKYNMLSHIRTHSQLVADIATYISNLAREKGMHPCHDVINAAALLHDLGKTYTVQYGGSHSQIAASWIMEETRNPAIAQCVLHHVYWPGEVDLSKHFEPLVIIYADKRVKHDMPVTLSQRFTDILERYGTNSLRRERILSSYTQNQYIEQELNKLLEVDLNAHSFNWRRLVQ